MTGEIYKFCCSDCGYTGFVTDEPGAYIVPVTCPSCGELCTGMPQDLSVTTLEKMLYFLQVNFSSEVEQ